MTWSEIRRATWFRWARELALVGLIVVGVAAYQSWNHLGSGETAPQFALSVLDGAELVSTASLAGKPTLIYFWAPWCGVCGATSDNVDDLREAVGDEANVVSIALSYGSVDEVRSFVAQNEAEYSVLLGTEPVRSDYAVDAFPTFYILDSDGRVRSSIVGYTTTLGLRLRLWWAD